MRYKDLVSEPDLGSGTSYIPEEIIIKLLTFFDPRNKNKEAQGLVSLFGY